MDRQRPDGVQKTKYMLANAMMWLLEKQSFRKISVGDICQEALISRSAFYVHFADKYELLKFCLRGMLHRQDEAARGQTLEMRMTALLESVQQNQRMLRNTFEADFSQELIELFENTFREYVDEHLTRLSGPDQPVSDEQRMVAAFLAGGVSNMVICWIREQFRTPAEELARCQCTLILRTLGVHAATIEEDEPIRKDAE